MNGRHRITSLAATACLGVLALAVFASCDRSPGGALLNAPGGDGVTFISDFSAVQVVGDFNGFDANIPSMTLNDTGVWVDTLTVEAGCYLMKLRTNDDWDETPDFGRCSGTEGDCQTQVPADGAPVEGDVCEVTGEGTAIGQLEFLETGSYEFAFDEREDVLSISRSVSGSIAGAVEFAGIGSGEDLPEATISVLTAGTVSVAASGTSSTVTGNYLVEGVPPGTYDLSILAPGYQEARIEGVVVTAFETITVATVTLQEGCTSAFQEIQIVGDFNGWDTSVESMTLVSACVWADTLTINPPSPADTCTFLKFRTGGDWTSNDYGNCGPEDETCSTPFSGSICQGSGSNDPDALGRLPLSLGGIYEVLIDEAAMTYEFRRLDIAGGTIEGIVGFSDSPQTLPAVTVSVRDTGTTNQVASGQSSVADGSFSIFAPAGTYDVLLQSAGYVDSLVTIVTVVVDQATDLGTIVLDAAAPGSISGTVAFDDAPGSLPVATIVVTDLGAGAAVDTVTSDPADGTFSVPDLAATIYSLEVSAPSYAAATVDSVAVPAGANADAGTITLARLRQGSISGTVTYSNSPPTPPAAQIFVREAGTQTPVRIGASNPADGTFQVDDIPIGIYDVLFQADGYVDSLVTGVDVVDQQITSLGTLQLFAQVSTSLQVVGDFNGWDEDAPQMTLQSNDTWVAIVAVDAGCHKIKFRTNGDWDETPDWGRCAGAVGDCQVQFTGSVLLADMCLGGVGLGASIGEVEFPSTGSYQFTVDEVGGEFLVIYLGP